MNEQTLSIIKPDAVERNLEKKIKIFFEKNNLKITKYKKVKKYILPRRKQQSFIKYIKQNHFIKIYVIIYHRVL